MAQLQLKKTLRLSELKGHIRNDPFYSDIEIRRGRMYSGVDATVTAFAPTAKLAREAAILFFGQMLDALAIKVNQPLFLNFSVQQRSSNSAKIKHDTLRRISGDEWETAFKEARLLASQETTFLRALGWYRKGLHTEDPFDKFLAFWNATEIVSGKYYPPIPERRSRGSKSQIWESFKALWGNCEYWPIIPGQNQWIDENYETRKTVAHGTQPVDINTVSEVAQKLDVIQQVSYKFLLEWRQQKLDLNYW